MSKHSTPEEKLHISRSIRPKHSSHRQRISYKMSKPTPLAPPKGINSNNQYR